MLLEGDKASVLLVKAKLKHKHSSICVLSHSLLCLSDMSSSMPAKALQYWAHVQCTGMVLQYSCIDSHKMPFVQTAQFRVLEHLHHYLSSDLKELRFFRVINSTALSQSY